MKEQLKESSELTAIFIASKKLLQKIINNKLSMENLIW
jgi:hypothetical protein